MNMQNIFHLKSLTAEHKMSANQCVPVCACVNWVKSLVPAVSQSPLQIQLHEEKFNHICKASTENLN